MTMMDAIEIESRECYTSIEFLLAFGFNSKVHYFDRSNNLLTCNKKSRNNEKVSHRPLKGRSF